MWICEVCGHQWSAMMSDSEVPERCECGGKTKEHYSGDAEMKLTITEESSFAQITELAESLGRKDTFGSGEDWTPEESDACFSSAIDYLVKWFGEDNVFFEA